MRANTATNSRRGSPLASSAPHKNLSRAPARGIIEQRPRPCPCCRTGCVTRTSRMPSTVAHRCQRFKPHWGTAISLPTAGTCMPVRTHRAACTSILGCSFDEDDPRLVRHHPHGHDQRHPYDDERSPWIAYGEFRHSVSRNHAVLMLRLTRAHELSGFSLIPAPRRGRQA